VIGQGGAGLALALDWPEAQVTLGK